MEAGNYRNEYFKNYRCRDEYGDYGDGCALLAAKQLYEVSGGETYFSFMKNYMDAFWTENGEGGKNLPDAFSADLVYGSRVLFFLYQVTKEEKYRRAFETVMNRLRGCPRCGCGNFADQGENLEALIDALYGIQPFYMEYETVYDKKEKYNDIIGQFENVQKMICGADGLPLGSMVRYLAALADTMDNMSFEIYEQYRKLQDMFRETMKDVLKKRNPESGLFHQETESGTDNGIDVFGSAVIGYCILKACRMGIVLKEKYIDTGMEIVEKLTAMMESSENEGCGTEEICASFMAYGQYLLTKKELGA